MSDAEFGIKQLTDKEMIEIITRAPNEIECADAYRHFLEDLGNLIADHFGGERGHVTAPGIEEDEPVLVCDDCGEVPVEHVKELWECKHLSERLEPGSEVPYGEHNFCGAFVYKRKEDEASWMCGFRHNECVPEDGWVYNDYDKDINWKMKAAEEESSEEAS